MVTGRCASPRSRDKHRKAVIAWCCAQVVMSANAFVMSFLAMPHNPTEHDVAARVSCTVKVIILVVQSYHLPVSLLVGSQANFLPMVPKVCTPASACLECSFIRASLQTRESTHDQRVLY